MKTLILPLLLFLFFSCSQDGDKMGELEFETIKILKDQSDDDGCWDVSELWNFDLELTNLTEDEIKWTAYRNEVGGSEYPITSDGEVFPDPDLPTTYYIIASHTDSEEADTLIINTEWCQCGYDMATDFFAVNGNKARLADPGNAFAVLELGSDFNNSLGTFSFPSGFIPDDGDSVALAFEQRDGTQANWLFSYVYTTDDLLAGPSPIEDGMPSPGPSNLILTLFRVGEKVKGSIEGTVVYNKFSASSIVMTNVKIEFTAGLLNADTGVFPCN